MKTIISSFSGSRFGFLLLALSTLSVIETVDAASPQLDRILPVGAQRGTEVELHFYGRRLNDAVDLFFYKPGIELVKVVEAKNDQVKALVKISKDCQLGPHEIRLRTETGVSELRTFQVSNLPIVEEKEPNSTFDSPQKIPINVSVSGIVQSEDVDCFVFEAKKGQRITAEVTGLRLGWTLFDSHVSILNSKRFELASNDDHPLLRQDGLASVIIPEDGQYQVHIRESSYGGNGNCRYLLHVGTFPRPTTVYPLGGPAGQDLEVKLLGDVAGEKSYKLKIEPEKASSFTFFPKEGNEITPSPVPFRVSHLKNTFEKEPNDRHKDANSGPAPVAFNGILQKPGDYDYFKFPAKKNQSFDIHVYGRRLRSPIDPILHIFNAKDNRRITGNDDAGGPDSYFRFRAPADGEYILRINDHLKRGGPTFVYRIEVDHIQAGLSLSIPTSRRFSQSGQTITVPRNNRTAVLLQISRSNFGGNVDLTALGLPPEVKFLADQMASNVSAIPIVFEASEKANVGGQLVNLTGKLADPKRKIEGGYDQSIALVYGQPNNAVYWTRKIDRLALAVAKEAAFEIEIVQPKAPLVRNGVMNLKVISKRKEGFKSAISLNMLFNPPGVGSSRGIRIPEGKNEATIRLNANGSAPVKDWKIAVTGSAGGVLVSSQLATLKIAQPYLAISLERAATETGKPTNIFGKMEVVTPFKGKAKVRLLGLPARVVTKEIEVTPETKELDFQLTVDAKSRPGRHRNIFCQVELLEQGEPVVHSSGSTELRIDKPIPPKPKKVAAKPKPKPKPKPKEVAKKTPPKPKRLTRLEKLRKQFKEKQEGGDK